MTSQVFLYHGQSSCEIPRTVKHVKVDQSVKEIPEGTFRECEFLSIVQLPEGLCRIGISAFQGCRILKVICVPSTVVEIKKNAFAFCYDLTSVEFSPRGLQALGDGVFHYCVSLVNTRLPSSLSKYGSELFAFCAKLHQQFDSREDSDIVLALQRRFDSLPLHELCYDQAYDQSSQETLGKLNDIILHEMNGVIRDCFGMTPLHILCLSQNADTAIFEEVMKLRLEDLMTKDKQGKLPLHYVCLSDAPIETFRLALDTQCTGFPDYRPDWKTLLWITETVDTYKYVVHSSVEARVTQLGLDAWREDIRDTIESGSQQWRFNNRPRHLRQVHSKLSMYERRETLSLLRLALWKAKIEQMEREQENEDPTDGVPPVRIDRPRCLVCCGDEVIESNVLVYLES